MTKRITVLLSGRGTNLAALLAAMREGTLGGGITRVISNRPEAQGINLAHAAGIATILVGVVVASRAAPKRAAI